MQFLVFRYRQKQMVLNVSVKRSIFCFFIHNQKKHFRTFFIIVRTEVVNALQNFLNRPKTIFCDLKQQNMSKASDNNVSL